MPFLTNLKQFFGLGPSANEPTTPANVVERSTPPPDPERSDKAPLPANVVEPTPVETADAAPATEPSEGRDAAAGNVVAQTPAAPERSGAAERSVVPGDLPPTPQQRDLLYRFIVEKLAPYANETASLPTGLTLVVCCASAEEEDRLSVALYEGQPGHFRAELSRHLANQYIRLAPDWTFTWQFVRDALPDTCTYQQGKLGLVVIRPETSQPLRARVRTLTGQTVQDSYVLDPAVQLDYRIGRGQTVQTASGRVRTNDIAFLDESEPGFDPQRGDPNLSVSRQHATIRYDAAGRRYRLFADAGGLPANGNKTKILRADDTTERADLPGVGYVLAPGDQIELGGEAKLLLDVLT